MNKNIKIITASLILTIFFFIFSVSSKVFVSIVKAQNAISLSITPPLFELMIQPGKEVKQEYSITNSGGDTTLVPKIVYFNSLDIIGNVNLTEEDAPEWVKYSKDPITIKSGGKIDFNVVFSPPEDTEETDHFLTLLFETSAPTDVLFNNASFYKSQIGTNILITVSKDGNPKKSAEITEFKLPKIVDSIFFNKIKYDVTLRNNGNSFWKPNGKIIFNNKTLKLAPQNIISGSVRKISCLDGENLVDCTINPGFIIGKQKTQIEFMTDDDPKIYKKEVTLYAFPFVIISLITSLLTIIKLRGILIICRKRR